MVLLLPLYGRLETCGRLLIGLLLALTQALATPETPPFTLSDDAVPRRYSIELTVDPDRDGGEFLGIELETPAGPGRAVLTLRYQAPLAGKAVIGPYRLKFENRWYVFTTFTPNGARDAFPCFDQPRFKTPWEFTIRVKRDLQAFTNSKAVREINEPGGMKRVEFAATEPLPSEVVAFAVGPFDILDSGETGRGRTPIRIVAPSGHAAEGEEAGRATTDVLWRIERYTGIPYPYDKLDHVAVPEMPFGAVENAGLITYRMRSLLFAPGKATPTQQRAVRAVEAREIAHQWFGDFVTQAVWEDVWLSEGFATWLSAKIMDEDQPASRKHLSAVAARDRIMATDAGPKTRPVRLLLNSRESLKDVYSQFVYQKGAAVLNMLEGWLGEDKVQTGLRVYLNDHRFGNATTGDLAGALRLASQTDPYDVMHDFLDQAGVPVVRSEIHCEPGTLPRIVFEQTNTTKHWDVPVCWKSNASANCTVVDTRRQVELGPMASCPVWVYTNANGSGYYRTAWDARQLATLADRALGSLTAAERLTLVFDIAELRRASKLDAAAVEPILKKLASDVEPEISAAAKKALEVK